MTRPELKWAHHHPPLSKGLLHLLEATSCPGHGLALQLLFSQGFHSQPCIYKVPQLWCSYAGYQPSLSFEGHALPAPGGMTITELPFAHVSSLMHRVLAPQITSVKEQLNVSIFCLRAFRGGRCWVLYTVQNDFLSTSYKLQRANTKITRRHHLPVTVWFY